MGNNVLDYFFKMGDKFTGGDPVKKADWDYYLLLVMFLAFFSILVGNLIDFYQTQKLYNLGWAFVMLAILWFQYFGLKSMYEMRKMLKNPTPPEKVETVDEMLKDFGVKEDKDKKTKDEELEEFEKF